MLSRVPLLTPISWPTHKRMLQFPRRRTTISCWCSPPTVHSIWWSSTLYADVYLYWQHGWVSSIPSWLRHSILITLSWACVRILDRSLIHYHTTLLLIYLFLRRIYTMCIERTHTYGNEILCLSLLIHVSVCYYIHVRVNSMFKYAHVHAYWYLMNQVDGLTSARNPKICETVTSVDLRNYFLRPYM